MHMVDLEVLVEQDMIRNGYDPDIWEDVMDYWMDRLDYWEE